LQQDDNEEPQAEKKPLTVWDSLCWGFTGVVVLILLSLAVVGAARLQNLYEKSTPEAEKERMLLLGRAATGNSSSALSLVDELSPRILLQSSKAGAKVLTDDSHAWRTVKKNASVSEWCRGLEEIDARAETLGCQSSPAPPFTSEFHSVGCREFLGSDFPKALVVAHRAQLERLMQLAPAPTISVAEASLIQGYLGTDERKFSFFKGMPLDWQEKFKRRFQEKRVRFQRDDPENTLGSTFDPYGYGVYSSFTRAEY
jgi:hypothetical protein